MLRQVGNMWHEYTTAPDMLFLFTANNVVKDGRLVMGAGSAKQARDMFPGLDKEIGQVIIAKPSTYKGNYGVIIGSGNVGAFQTKKHYRDKSSEDIIRFSVNVLLAYCEKYSIIHMPYPGIGYGGMSMEHVENIISVLPDNVHVWTLA